MPSPSSSNNGKKPGASDVGNVWLRRACWTLLILVIISFVLMIFWPQMYEEKEWQMWYNDTPKKKSRVGGLDDDATRQRFEFYYSKSCAVSMEQMLPALTQIVAKEYPEITLELIACDEPQYERLCDGGEVPRLVYRPCQGGRAVVYEGPLQYHTMLYWINEMMRSQA